MIVPNDFSKTDVCLEEKFLFKSKKIKTVVNTLASFSHPKRREILSFEADVHKILNFRNSSDNDKLKKSYLSCFYLY